MDEPLDPIKLLQFLSRFGNLINFIYNSYDGTETLESICTDCITTWRLITHLFSTGIPRDIKFDGVEILKEISIIENNQYNVKGIVASNRQQFYTVIPLLIALLKEHRFCSITMDNIRYRDVHFMNLLYINDRVIDISSFGGRYSFKLVYYDINVIFNLLNLALNFNVNAYQQLFGSDEGDYSTTAEDLDIDFEFTTFRVPSRAEILVLLNKGYRQLQKFPKFDFHDQLNQAIREFNKL